MLSPISPSRRKSILKAQLENSQGSRKHRPQSKGILLMFFNNCFLPHKHYLFYRKIQVNSYSVALPQDKLPGPVPKTTPGANRASPAPNPAWGQHQGPTANNSAFLRLNSRQDVLEDVSSSDMQEERGTLLSCEAGSRHFQK